MKTTNKILLTLAASSILASSSLVASSEQPSDISLMAQVILKQQQEIEELKSQIKSFSTSIKTVDNSIAYEHEVINVQEWANYRKKPWGKIIKELPLGSKVNIIECSELAGGLTWCKSPDHGGGYISSKLVSWKKND
jgi:hypothetical protein